MSEIEEIKSRLSLPQLGKIPPQSIDLEGVVLGACLLERSAPAVALEILESTDFYLEKHGLIFESIQDLFNKGKTPDLLLVTEKLIESGKLRDVGGSSFIASLTNKVASTANLEEHCYIIKQKSMRRSIIRRSNEAIKTAYDETIDVFDVIDGVQNGIMETTSILDKRKVVGSYQMVNMMEEHWERVENTSFVGIRSLLTNVDRKIRGFKNGQLIILAARPGMGKSAFCERIIKGSIEDNKPVLFFSLEMSVLDICTRLFSVEVGLSSLDIMEGRVNNEQKQQINRMLAKLTDDQGNDLLFIDDSQGLSITQIRSKAKNMKFNHGIGCIIVDYLQLMKGTKDARGNREQEISQISRGLKGLAKELDVPVIALSQLSRAVETRGGNKMPQLSDLRESGSIEQDADVVMFLYRPEYYFADNPDIFYTYKGEQLPLEGWCDVIIAKARFGGLGTASIRWDKNTTRFYNPD